MFVFNRDGPVLRAWRHKDPQRLAVQGVEWIEDAHRFALHRTQGIVRQSVSSARPLSGSGRRSHRRRPMGGGPQRLPRSRQGARGDLSRNVSGKAAQGLATATRATLGADQAVGCLLQGGCSGKRTGLAIPGPVCPSHCPDQQPIGSRRRRSGDVPLSSSQTAALEDDDPAGDGVHPAISAARAAPRNSQGAVLRVVESVPPYFAAPDPTGHRTRPIACRDGRRGRNAGGQHTGNLVRGSEEVPALR